jgi:hypothetical protein
MGDDAPVGSPQRAMYVHVGAPKTGTTYLQTVLWRAKRHLREEQGLTLPGRRVEDHVHAAQDLRHLHDEKDYSPLSRGGLDRFAGALDRVATPRALFSQEMLAPALPDQVDRFLGLLDGFEVHIVITARDLARQIPSGWQQRVKRRTGISYEDYLKLVLDDPDLSYPFWHSQDIADVARRWGKPLSPDRVHIVTLPPPGSPPGWLLERFCSVIGVDHTRLDTEVARDNSGLSAPQAELMRRVNLALGDRLVHRQEGYNRLGKRYFAKEVLAQQIGPPLKVPGRYAGVCRELADRMVAEIRAEGYDVVGDLAELEPTVFGESTGEVDTFDADVTDATVAEAGVQALATVLARRYDDLLVIAGLRSELAAAQDSWIRRQQRRVAAAEPRLLLSKLPASVKQSRPVQAARRMRRRAAPAPKT